MCTHNHKFGKRDSSYLVVSALLGMLERIELSISVYFQFSIMYIKYLNQVVL